MHSTLFFIPLYLTLIHLTRLSPTVLYRCTLIFAFLVFPTSIGVDGYRDRRHSPTYYEDSEGEEPFRVFVALFDYDPMSMSPNPDGADEELPFKEGQIIKVSLPAVRRPATSLSFQAVYCQAFLCAFRPCYHAPPSTGVRRQGHRWFLQRTAEGSYGAAALQHGVGNPG